MTPAPFAYSRARTVDDIVRQAAPYFLDAIEYDAEAVANAMVNGNRNDPGRLVIVDIEFDSDQIVIAVSDEGDGFDPEAVPDPNHPTTLDATRGRGLYMIRSLADHVAFNDRGNTIWMTLPRC